MAEHKTKRRQLMNNMVKLVLFLSAAECMCAGTVDWTTENRRIEAEQVSLWESKLAEARSKLPDARLAELALGLRNMGFRIQNHDGHSPSVDAIYSSIQNELLAIPGHARYFQEAIEREQEAVKDYPTTTGPRVSYDFNRTRHFETLSHLPSPETIAVLGHFLADDKDTPKPLMTPGSDWGTNPRANSYGSAYTLTNVGLRDAPGTWKDYDADPDAQLAKTRAWWDEVKAGRKTFSFKGQSVEYRFKRDGTWETLAMVNAPDDGPKVAGKVERPEDRVAEPGAGEIQREWVWLILPVILVAGFGVWLVAKRFAKVP